MPILPPRNMPLSPSGKTDLKKSNQNNQRSISTPPRKGGGNGGGNVSPSTPSPSKRRGHEAVPSSSSFVHSPLASSIADLSISSVHTSSGHLTREEETTFHRRLRTLLWDHRAARENWDDIVSIQGAKGTAAVCRYAQRLDELVKVDGDQKELPDEYELLPIPLRISKAEIQARKADELAKTLKNLKEEQNNLQTIVPKIGKALNKLQTLGDAAETLLIEATRTKGDEFAFEQEAWLTWPIARFVSVIQDITSRYSIQTDYLQMIITILFDQGCITGTSAKAQEDIHFRGFRAEEKNEENDEEEEEEEQESSTSKKARKVRALVRQRILEEWQALSFLRDDRNPDPMWFEDVCSAEVSRWDER